MSLVKSVRPFDIKNTPQAPQVKDPINIPWGTLPVDLELGCGTGMHSINYAKENPKRHLIAIEQTQNKFKQLQTTLQKNPLTNLTPIRANAIHWVPFAVPDASIDRCFILYPNPYPKKKHENLRWHYMPFMHNLIQKLKPNGEIIVATNMDWLIQESTSQITQFWGLKLNQQFQLSSDFNPRTLFEKKYLERGEACHQAIYTKS